MSPPPVSRPRPAFVTAWAALVLLVLALSLHGYDSFQLGTFRDDARYVILARSIVTGDAYALDHAPGPPRRAPYPFGFPLLLAPFVWLWPGQLDGGKVVSLVATLVNVSLLFWGWRLLARNGSVWWGPVVAALYGLSPLVIGHARMVMSDAVFTTFALATLLLGEHCARRGRPPRVSSVLGLGVALAGALFTRAVGLGVVAALFVRFSLPRPHPHALRSVGGAVLVVCGILGAVMLLTPVRAINLVPPGYVREVEAQWIGPQGFVRASGSSLAFVRRRIAPVPHELRALLLPLGGGQREAAVVKRYRLDALPAVLDIVVTALVVLGIWEGRRGPRLSAMVLLYELIYVVILLMWSTPVPRLLYPIQPFLACQLLLGVRCLARPVIGSPRGAALCVAAVWAVVAGASLYKSAVVVDSRQFVRDFRVGTDWLRAHAPSEAIVMAHEPEIIHLYAGRKTVAVPAVHSAEEMEQLVDAQQVAYVLVGPRLQWGELGYDDSVQVLIRFLADLTRRGRLEAVYASERDKVHVYRVVRSLGEDG